MPELPEVEVVKMQLSPLVSGRTIIESHILFEKLIKKQEVSYFIDIVNGLKIIQLIRKGKYLVYECEKEGEDLYIISHLMMTGAFFLVDSLDEIIPKYKNYLRAWFLLDNDKKLTFCDIRKFGVLKVLNKDEYSTYKPFITMGPEPFDENGLELFMKNIRMKQYEDKPIKDLLISYPRIIVGAGNIYGNEVAHLIGVHPECTPTKLTDDTLIRLFYGLKSLFRESIASGGTTFSDYVNPNGMIGQNQKNLKVYQQKVCKTCGTSIEKILINDRSTYFCPNCQNKCNSH